MDIAGLNWTSNVPRLLWHRECPRCSSIKFTAAELHPIDRVLRLLTLRPVRCVNCWRRYYWFAKRRVDGA
jgi:hypothetical protein